VGDDGGSAPSTSRSWCCDGWTRTSNAATPGTAGSPEQAGEVAATQITNPPRLAEHRRREELQCIDDRVPPEPAHLLLRFDGSIVVDRTWGEVAAWCDAEAANVLGLQMVDELVTGNPA
jgi:hypothetical protein